MQQGQDPVGACDVCDKLCQKKVRAVWPTTWSWSAHIGGNLADKDNPQFMHHIAVQ